MKTYPLLVGHGGVFKVGDDGQATMEVVLAHHDCQLCLIADLTARMLLLEKKIGQHDDRLDRIEE